VLQSQISRDSRPLCNQLRESIDAGFCAGWLAAAAASLRTNSCSIAYTLQGKAAQSSYGILSMTKFESTLICSAAAWCT
jgi:hypothetical protein